jgi:Tfp pilus assembly protein PilN
MIRINLLPPEVRSSERKIDPRLYVAGTGIVLIGFLIPFSLIQVSRRSKLRSEKENLSSELKRYEPIVAQVEALEAAKAQLQQRKGIIQQLENERLRYPYFMEDFLKLLPSNVWLTSLTTTMPTDGSTIAVSMDVTALDHYAVADLVSNLETSQIFTEVDMGTLTLAAGSTGGQTITFHLNTTYRKAASNAPQG